MKLMEKCVGGVDNVGETDVGDDDDDDGVDVDVDLEKMVQKMVIIEDVGDVNDMRCGWCMLDRWSEEWGGQQFFGKKTFAQASGILATVLQTLLEKGFLIKCLSCDCALHARPLE